VYTDGGASPNPGPGGWAAVIRSPDGSVEEISGGAPGTTNNRMELQAAISALARLTTPSAVDLYTDSTYVRQGITRWVAQWRAQGWRRRDGGKVKNLDLWRRLEGLNRRHRVNWHWVKGHAGNVWNERVDALASAEIAALGGSGAGDGAEDSAIPAGSVRIFVKVRCVGRRGSWTADVVYPEGRAAVSNGRAGGTTPNRLEMEAVLELLEGVPADRPVAVYTGNDYLRRGASLWLRGWKRNGWRTKAGGAVKNASLWRRLDREMKERQVFWPQPSGEARERLGALKERVRGR